MTNHADKVQEQKGTAVAKTSSSKQMANQATFQLMDNRPQTLIHRNLQNTVNNSPPIKQALQLQRMAKGHFSSQEAPVQKKADHCIQAKIKIEDGEFLKWTEITALDNWDTLSAAQVKAVLGWWSSDTEHNFKKTSKGSAKENLIRAAKRSQQALVQGPVLYKKANLKYITKSEGRTPTLYFEGGGITGRLRTKHDTGPLADIDAFPTVRIFSKEKLSSKDFTAMYREGEKKTLKKDWNTVLPDTHTLTPTNGYYQIEVSYEGNICKGLHPSGGIVSTDLSAYTDLIISQIFNGITGKTE